MRYQSFVTDFAHQQPLSHLSGAAMSLTSALARPRWIALTCIATLTALGWLAIGLMVGTGHTGSYVAAICRIDSSTGVDGLGLAALMWAAMVLAMMLPTAGPMIVTYADIADTAARKGEPAVSPLVLAAGYVAVWLGFAAFAAVVQWTTAAMSAAAIAQGGSLPAAIVLLGAGLYQFSPLKLACLTQCQRPFPFFFANWTTQAIGVLRLGVKQGLLCLGCCWALMMLMFVTGTMNVVWMAALGIVMTIEKLTTHAGFARAVGVVLIGVGLVLLTTLAMQVMAWT